MTGLFLMLLGVVIVFAAIMGFVIAAAADLPRRERQRREREQSQEWERAQRIDQHDAVGLTKR
jgi:uncharacterized integral membrane protein